MNLQPKPQPAEMGGSLIPAHGALPAPDRLFGVAEPPVMLRIDDLKPRCGRHFLSH